MKLNRLFLVVLLLTMSAAVAKADGVPPGDPKVIEKGPGSDAPAGIVFSNFALSSATGDSPATSPCKLIEPFPGGGSINSMNCQFQNDLTDPFSNGAAINELVLDLPGFPPNVPALLVTCEVGEGDVLGDFAPGCTVTSDNGGGSLVTFSGGTGIPYGNIFTLEFVGFTGGFTDATGYANVPEPASLLLLLVGFVALVGFGLKRAPQQA